MAVDLGSGTGTIASWMASELVPQGQVQAVDLKPTESSDPNVVVVRGDLRAYRPDPPASLVHARYVFGHLHDREAQVERAFGHLRPGGHLVITEPVICALPHGIPDCVRTVFSAYHEWISATGMSLSFATAVPTILGALGCSDMHCTMRPSRFGGGPGLDSWVPLIRSVADHLIELGVGPSALEEFYREGDRRSTFVVPQTIWTIHGAKA